MIILCAHSNPIEAAMQPSHAKILIFDDDPMHLEIHGAIKQADYDSLPALVRFS